MTEAQSVGTERGSPGLPQLVAQRIKAEGKWATLAWLHQQQRAQPGDVALRGYVEILRVTIVRDFLAIATGMEAIPKLTADFLNDFNKFDLTAQEGYLISQIDGRTNIEKLLKVSPFDPFSTLFSLARMNNMRAIEISE
jgi:hypothetical protein